MLNKIKAKLKRLNLSDYIVGESTVPCDGYIREAVIIYYDGFFKELGDREWVKMINLKSCSISQLFTL